MVSIHGLPPGVPGPGKTSKARKAQKEQPAASDATENDASPVAQAVARSLYSHVDPADFRQKLHYDLPEGRSRKALAAYFNVMNQAQKDELMQLLGVDIYI